MQMPMKGVRWLLQPEGADLSALPGLHGRLEGFCQCPLALGGPAHHHCYAAPPALGRRADDSHACTKYPIHITHLQESTEKLAWHAETAL